MIKYIQAIPASEANGLVAQTYAQIRREFGMLVEPFTLHSPAPAVLAGSWIGVYETLLVGKVRREVKEAVATAISYANRCPYCVEAHTIMMHAASSHDAARRISDGKPEELEDIEIRTAVEWAAASGSMNAPKLPPAQRPELIGTAVAFHYINRMVSALLGEHLLISNLGWLKRIQTRAAGWRFIGAVRRTKRRGASLSLLPAAEPPPDLAWATPAPNIKEAFARWTAAVEDAGQSVLSERVRDTVSRCIERWAGDPPKLGNAWTEEVTAGLPPDDAADARIALLAALAPHRIGADTVADFRSRHPKDHQLVSALAWASLTAARRIGQWL